MGNKRGRPSVYSEDIAEQILVGLATGDSLGKVCKDEALPCFRTVFNWINTKPDFLQRYERAKEMGCEAMAEQMNDIAEDEDRDTQRARLMVDTRKWYLSKIKAKKYGERLDTTVTHQFANLDDDELEARIKELENKA